MDPRQRYLAILSLVLIAVLAWWHLEGKGAAGMELRHVGTWTDPNGPAGNRITFALVWQDLPDCPGQVGLGTVTARGWFGQDEYTGSWNYESTHPLRLNVSNRHRSYLVPIEFNLDGGMRLALHENYDDASGLNALHGPNVKVLVRLPGLERK